MVEKKDLKEKIEEENSKDEYIMKLKAELKSQREAMQKRMEEMEKQVKYAPKDAPIPKEQQGLPEGMQESDILTTVKDMSGIINDKMAQLKDIATMEILLEPVVRAKNRLDSIKKMTSAEHIKVRGIWKTTPPKMHVSGLLVKKISNDEYEINFGVYEIDDKGNKRLYTQYAEFIMHDGSKINRPTSAEYRIAYEVIETIRTKKPISREVVRLDKKIQE